MPKYELLKDAYAIIDGIPDEAINLRNIMSRVGPTLDCGTIACAAGWLAQHPQFIELGLTAQLEPLCTLSWRGVHDSYDIILAGVFDISTHTASNLFGPRGWSTYDKAKAMNKTLSDKELWKNRVRAYLEENGQL